MKRVRKFQEFVEGIRKGCLETMHPADFAAHFAGVAGGRCDNPDFVSFGAERFDHLLDMNGLPIPGCRAVMIENLHSSIDFRLLQSHS